MSSHLIKIYEALTKLIVKDGRRYVSFCQYDVILQRKAQDLNPVKKLKK